MRSFVLVCLFALFAVASVSALHADVASLMNEDGVEYVFAEEVSSLETRTSAGFPITAAQLAAATGMSASTAATWLAPIQAAANAYDISNAKRMAAFLGQCGHESGGFTTFVENLNYKVTHTPDTRGCTPLCVHGRREKAQLLPEALFSCVCPSFMYSCLFPLFPLVV